MLITHYGCCTKTAFDLVHGVCPCIPYHVPSTPTIFNLSTAISVRILVPCFRCCILRFFSEGIKRVYIGSQVIYAIGMLLMGVFRHRLAVIVLSAVAGVLYSTLFTIPYLLVSQYHASTSVGLCFVC